MPGIRPAKALELRGEMVRVDDEGFHSNGAQMIKRECNERFLKDRNERLGQVIRERAEPGP
jgi:hypothetical protein